MLNNMKVNRFASKWKSKFWKQRYTIQNVVNLQIYEFTTLILNIFNVLSFYI